MLKTRCIALFAFIFTYLHATPLCRTAVGDKATATFKKLNGATTFEQITEDTLSVNGVLNKGIDENSPDDYFIDINGNKASFAQLGISINSPKAGLWSATSSGDIEELIDLNMAIYHNDDIIDDPLIVKE
ncbi:13465_t:CDS:1 [Racocetra persica]|uniref:13465_t:CDS:1 n=1 Tax=Racocetra persica TaxID=160502 RepID=A0ACA9M9J0_9GLOM|nr:13465_t:CDS:1 [Racocetra persica]